MLSILHRACGYALAIGTLMVVWWLAAAASGPKAYYTAMYFAETPLGTFMLFGWSFALFYHMCNGIRHLMWDMGYGLGISCAYKAGYMVLFVSIVLTIGVWTCGCWW